MLDIKKLLAKLIEASSLDYNHPIGSAYSTIDSSFDPNNVWGGTWEKLPEGYVLLSGSENGSYIVGDDINTGSGYKEYGSNTHTLTVSEMPSHTHNVQMQYNSGSGSAYAIPPTSSAVKWSWTSGRIQNTGGGKAHSIMQKSIAVYWWIRTA